MQAQESKNPKTITMLDQIIAQRRIDMEISKQTVSAEALDAKILEFDAQYGKPINVLERLRNPTLVSWSLADCAH